VKAGAKANATNPWASIPTGLVKRKPHQGQCSSYNMLFGVQKRDGAIGLHHFDQLRTMGDGDLGVVQLIKLTGSDSNRYAMKTIDKK
jgi:hypothetical protein